MYVWYMYAETADGKTDTSFAALEFPLVRRAPLVYNGGRADVNDDKAVEISVCRGKHSKTGLGNS